MYQLITETYYMKELTHLHDVYTGEIKGIQFNLDTVNEMLELKEKFSRSFVRELQDSKLKNETRIKTLEDVINKIDLLIKTL